MLLVYSEDIFEVLMVPRFFPVSNLVLVTNLTWPFKSSANPRLSLGL